MLKKDTVRKRRHLKIRSKISGTDKRPRVMVKRSNLRMYVQVFNDIKGEVLIAMRTDVFTSKAKVKPIEVCTNMGKALAEDLKKKKVSEIVFDRGGYKYHGRVKAVAEGLREGGIKF